MLSLGLSLNIETGAEKSLGLDIESKESKVSVYILRLWKVKSQSRL